MPAQFQNHPADTAENRAKQKWRGYSDAMLSGIFGQSDNMGPITQGLIDAYRDGWDKGQDQRNGRYFALEGHPMWGQQVEISGDRLDPRVDADGMTGQICFVYQMADGEIRAEVALDVDDADDVDLTDEERDALSFRPTTADVPLTACTTTEPAPAPPFR